MCPVVLTALVLAGAATMPGMARAGVPPPMAFSPGFWFAATQAGTSTTQEFVLTNTGANATGALQLTIFPQGSFTVSTDGCTGVSLGPGKSCRVTLRFAPLTAGTSRAGLTASSRKASLAGLSLTGVSWLTGSEACDQVGGVFGADDQIADRDRPVNWTCNDWVATSEAGPLLSGACQHTPPGSSAFIAVVVANIGDATCYG